MSESASKARTVGVVKERGSRRWKAAENQHSWPSGKRVGVKRRRLPGRAEPSAAEHVSRSPASWMDAQPTEPPCTDPYARWCGRGGAARLPPIPISPTLGPSPVVDRSFSHAAPHIRRRSRWIPHFSAARGTEPVAATWDALPRCVLSCIKILLVPSGSRSATWRAQDQARPTTRLPSQERSRSTAQQRRSSRRRPACFSE